MNGNMDNDLLLQYLLTQGTYTPEEERIARQQSVVDALRKQSMTAPQMRQAGRVVVAPSWAEGLGNIAQGLSAQYQQRGLDEEAKRMQASRISDILKMTSGRGQQSGGDMMGGNPEMLKMYRFLTGNATQKDIEEIKQDRLRRGLGLISG
jgi:hypothetical protein